MVEQISNDVIMWKAVAGILGIILPIMVLIIWKKKNKSVSVRPAVVGAVTFFIFSQILESIPKTLLFTLDSGVSDYIWTHAWAYVLAGSLLAGIFEEVGRFVAFRFFLKSERNPKDAITYGIGHGGIESVIVAGIGALNSISIVLLVNSGVLMQSVSDMGLGQMKTIELQVSALAGYGAVTMLLEVFERIVAMVLHIALSLVVFQAVHESKIGYLLLAIILHAVFDVPAALYQCGVIGIGFAEILLFAGALVSVCVARKMQMLRK